MKKNKTIAINYLGTELEISGSWVPYRPAKITADPSKSYPAEGGYFEVCTVRAAGENPDITELLDSKDGKELWEKIMEEVNEKAGREENENHDYY